MLVALAALGQARTTRQSRGVAIAISVAVIIAVRVGGFAAQTLAARSAAGEWLAFAIPLIVSLASLAIIFDLARPRMPQVLTKLADAIAERVPRPDGAKA